MKCVVLVKGVPDFREGKVSFKEDNTLNRGATPTVLNPNDRIALAAALEVKVKNGGSVSIVSMGPPNYKSILKEAMEVYADDAFLLSDRMMGGADTLATAETIAAGLRKMGLPDLVIAGFKSADGETGQTGPQTAWVLDFPIITHVISLEVDEAGKKVRARRTAGEDVEDIEAPLPCFIVTDPGFTSNFRSASHRLKLLRFSEETVERAKTIDSVFKQWGVADLPVDPKKIGLKGSPTIVNKVEPIPVAAKERTAKIVDGKDPRQLEDVARQIVQLVKGAA